MIACIDGGIFCVGVPALLIALFPCIGVWLKRRCKCKTPPLAPKMDPVLEAMRERIYNRVEAAKNRKP